MDTICLLLRVNSEKYFSFSKRLPKGNYISLLKVYRYFVSLFFCSKNWQKSGPTTITKVRAVRVVELTTEDFASVSLNRTAGDGSERLRSVPHTRYTYKQLGLNRVLRRQVVLSNKNWVYHKPMFCQLKVLGTTQSSSLWRVLFVNCRHLRLIL